MSGFSYNGKHIREFGCEYIPNETERWFDSPDFTIYESTDVPRDGGYYYGNNAKVRTFQLPCFFEDITLATREAIRRWFDRNTEGELIFDDRPFAAYHVRPTKIVSGKIYAVYNPVSGEEVYSGTMTITLTAYDPYGYLRYDAYEQFDDDGATQYCGMLAQSMMPPSPTVSSRSFLMYNPGTQRCNTVFQIGGTAANGLTITNETNGSTCEILSLPSTGYLEIDSRLGAVTWVHGTARDLAFSRHGEGFIVLEPYMAFDDKATVKYTAGSTSAEILYTTTPENLVGKYLYIDGAWNKVLSVTDEGVATMQNAAAHDGIAEAKAVTMNEITITGDSVTLTRLEAHSFPIIV